MPFPWEISGDDLVQWASRRDAPGRLPILIRRLLASTLPLRALEMRGDAGVQLGGWDGVVSAAQGNAWCPAGASYWELTVQTDDAKLNDDFRKRIEQAPQWASTASYVAVIAGRYTQRKGKAGWEEARRREGPWARVRLLDADDLATWLEQSPTASLWMASELGRPVAGITLPEEALRLWCGETQPALPSDVLTIGAMREDGAEMLRAALVDPRGVGWVGIEGVPDDEARAFALAAIVNDPDPARRERSLSRCVVVDDAETWRWLVRTSLPSNPLVLIPGFDGADINAARHRAIVVSAARRDDAANPHITLDDYLPFDLLGERLVRLGMREQDARTYVSRSSGRLSDLRRLLGALPLPSWAKEHPAALWIPLMLVERWRPGYDADRKIIERLGATAVELERLCEALSTLTDRPVRRAEEWDHGVTWEWCAPDTTWVLLAGRIPESDLRRFAAIAVDVFETPDPKFDAPAKDRFVAGAFDRTHRPSAAIREGIARTLARLGNGVSVDRPQTVARLGANVAASVVGPVLTPSWKRWAALSAELPWIAEAAPSVFLDRMKRSLTNDDGCARLLAEEDLSSTPHTGLLWALERLAWHPRWFPTVIDALAMLAQNDQGGRIVNRPQASLGTILAAVAPQTTASLDERFAAIERVTAKYPAVGWKLLLGLLSRARGGTIWESDRPKYLEVEGMPDRPGTLNTEDAERMFGFAVERAIQSAGLDAERWCELVAPNGRWHDDIESRLLDAFEEKEPSITEGRERLWSALRGALSRSQLLDDEGRRERLRRLHERFAPADFVARHAWLFGRVPSNLFSRDWRENEAIALKKQEAVVREIAAMSDGGPTLERLAGLASRPADLGIRIAASPLADRFLEQLREGTLVASLRRVQPAFMLRMREERGDAWITEELRSVVAKGRTEEAIEIATCVGVDPHWWRIAEDVGGEVATGFWTRARVWSVRDLSASEREVVASRLLQHEREFELLYVLAPEKESTVASSVIVAALEGLAKRPGALQQLPSDQAGDSLFWTIEQAFLALDRAGDVSEVKLASLEIGLLGVVISTTRSARALHRVLGAHPELFVDFICRIYPADGVAPSEAVDDRARNAAEAATRVFHEWHGYPGDSLSSAEGREEHVEAWATEVLRLGAAERRARSARYPLGEVLARVPASDDGLWPCVAARKLLERDADDDLLRAMYSAKRYPQEVRGRAIGAGGVQERALAEEHRGNAERLRRDWPRAAALLDALADSYAQDAQHQDEHARTERERWGIDPSCAAGATMTDVPVTPPPSRGAELLFLHGMTFTQEAAAPLGARLTLVTGDNSTGKSVVLDVLWWALTGTWTQDSNPVLPDRGANGKAKIGLRFSDGVEHHARFDPKREVWQRPEGWERSDALTIYARIDGGFSVFDPVRASTVRLSSEEVYEGQRVEGAKSCNGLIDDLPQWQARLRRLFDAMNAALARLSPGDASLSIGGPVRVSIHDTRDFPTVRLPYGEIPVSQVSSAVRRVLGMAYVILWAWHEHQEAARLAQEAAVRSVVLLVDEVEAHLHPEWQRRILRGLLEATEAVVGDVSVQTVVVTHSPLVVASAEAVFDATRDKLLHLALRDGSVSFEELRFEKEGDASAWLTSPAFGLDSSRSVEAEDAVKGATSLLAAQHITQEALLAQHAALRDALAPTDPFFVRWVRHLRQRGIEP